MDDIISIVLACDNNYASHALVVASSIIDHTQSKVWFHILCDSIDGITQDRMRASIKRKDVDVSFYDTDSSVMSDIYISDHISKAAYLRLMIGDILPNDINKVIYLDVDLVVCKDIKELWQVDMHDHVLAAVPDYGILSSKKSLAEKHKSFGWKRDNGYFNSGVLVINLVKWREQGYGVNVLNASQTHNFRHHDQDALNMVVDGNWEPLDLSWNVIPPVYELKPAILMCTQLRKNAIKANKNIGILHWAGRKKPWQYQLYEPFNGEYYKYTKNVANHASFPFRKKIVLQFRKFILGRA